MKTTYTKEQAEQVLKDYNKMFNFHQDLSEDDKDFLNHKFPSLEVGKWYMHLDNLLFYVREIIENKCYGYGFWDGEWFNNDKIIHYINQGIEDMRQATEKEVEEALIAEAKRRGYKDGVRLNSTGINKKYDWELKVNWSKIKYIPNRNVLDSGDGHIFENGQWAEIVDPTKDKIAELEATINKAQQELKELKGLVD